MKFYAQTSLVLGLLLSGSGALAQDNEPWPERYYNPAPLADDLVMPMPCNGAMTFRPVETPNTDGLVGDVRVTLGQEGEETPYLNGLRRSYISGGFQADDQSLKGLFYIGKYEVAEAQWAVMMSDTCPEDKFRKRDFSPMTDITPLQMAQFAERYSLWLMRKAEDSLPRAEETVGFLRLPTEDEWEYAARGGLSVSDASFRAPRPPIQEGEDIAEYVAHGGTQSAGGQVQVIGTLKPNPLGIHDMMGNIAEVVETPFAIVRHGRLHGQSGGIVKRGGDARSSITTITSATRFEVPPFSINSKEPFSDRYTGFRLVIAGLSITSSDSANQMVTDLNRMATSESPISLSENDVDRALDLLSEEVGTPIGERQLTVVKETILASRAERNAQQARSIRLVMESGTHICDQIVGRLRNAEFIAGQLSEIDDIEQEARQNQDQDTLDQIPAVRAETRAKLDELLANLDRDLTDFGEIVEGLADGSVLSELFKQSSFIASDVVEGGERRRACLVAVEDSLSDRFSKGFTEIDWVEGRLAEIATAETQ